MQWNLSKVLSFNAGYVDTASFLALHGLFAAHVTGNFVTLGAALISDNHAGAWTKLAALPMFCVVVLATRLLHTRLERLSRSSYRILLLIMLALFAVAAVLAWLNMPFVLVKPRRTLLSENFHTPMDSFHCWLYEAV